MKICGMADVNLILEDALTRLALHDNGEVRLLTDALIRCIALNEELEEALEEAIREQESATDRAEIAVNAINSIAEEAARVKSCLR